MRIIAKNETVINEIVLESGAYYQIALTELNSYSIAIPQERTLDWILWLPMTSQLSELARFITYDKNTQKVLTLARSYGVFPCLFKFDIKMSIPELSQVYPQGYLIVRPPQVKAEYEFIQRVKEITILVPKTWVTLPDEIIIEKHDLRDPQYNIPPGVFEYRADQFISTSRTKESEAIREEIKRNLENHNTDFLHKKPYVRAASISTFPYGKQAVLDLVFDQTQKRFAQNRALDRIRAIFSVDNSILRDILGNSNEVSECLNNTWIQLPEAPVIAKYSEALLGYQVKESISALDLMNTIINVIGYEGLPYTIYLIGSNAISTMAVKDYFIKAYPDLKMNFVGVSTPKEFTESSLKQLFQVINDKRPDFAFISLSNRQAYQLISQMKKQAVNCGITLLVGNGFGQFTQGGRTHKNSIIESAKLLLKIYFNRFK